MAYDGLSAAIQPLFVLFHYSTCHSLVQEPVSPVTIFPRFPLSQRRLLFDLGQSYIYICRDRLVRGRSTALFTS